VIVAIHQPNYAPWLGYFAKIARADIFIFLDDAQYTKNSYINRVQIDGSGSPRWLTLPVRYRFGDPVNRVLPAGHDWAHSHLDTLRTYYRRAPEFATVWPLLEEAYRMLPASNLAAVNQSLIEALASRIGVSSRFHRASDLDPEKTSRADDRIIALVRGFGGGASYLSGRGGAAYQDPRKFRDAGIELRYLSFSPPRYGQGHDGFVEGLSIIDALFNLGWKRVRDMISVPHEAGASD
jgi:hypothetical protein